jgi:hypothetical protein
MWRRLRIIVLLLILLFVALNTYFDRVYSTDWDTPLRVLVYPINGDGSTVTQSFVSGGRPDGFETLHAFFEQEAGEYGIALEQPVRLTLAPQLRELPPLVEPDAGPLSIAWWSLRMRYWAWRTPEPPGAAPDIKLFLIHHDPARSKSLPHSLGLQKGLFGIVHVFADQGMVGSNDVVLAHELLHTLGATDKYDLETDEPAHPDGFAEPDREPLYPQSFAELMGGRIPLARDESVTPESLQQVIVGDKTAREIGWRKE